VEDGHCLVGMSLVPGLGPRRFDSLLRAFGSPAGAWQAPEEALASLPGLGETFIKDFLAARRSLSLDAEWQKVRDRGISVLGREDPGYPPLLKKIHDPPFLLYARGRQVQWERPWIAVVGSRKMTAYGRELAFWLGRELAARGIGVVSGLARGIDTWAHRGALKGGGETAAVLGTGLDTCYPAENRLLAEEISRAGLLLSEFPLGTGPKPQHFPLRNRIISGISLGTVVVEAAEKSGALITADLALEQGREVFALPGPINSPMSRGCHSLIQQGAKLVQGIEDLLEELPGYSPPAAGAAAAGGEPLSPDEEKLLELLPYHPHPVDDLAGASGLPVSRVKAALTMLEIKGMIAQEAGNFVLRIK
jgi:DNA processing protein